MGMGSPGRPDDQSGLAARALSFGAHAAAYARHRPDYPAAVIEWGLAPLPRPDRARVLDVGAGTGKLTEVIRHQVRSVVAVEPDESMLAELRRQVPSAGALPGTAEEIPLPDDAVDAVFAGQAAHWFDMDRALPEFARVLRPGGVFVVVANTTDDRVSWVRGYCELATEVGTVSRDDWSLPDWTTAAPFASRHMTEFRHSVRHTADSLVAMLATHSAFIVMPDDERERRLGAVRAYLRSRPETATGEFDLPLVTMALRMRI